MLRQFAVGFALIAFAVSAVAEDMPNMGKTMHHMDKSNASMHTMPATVSSVDPTTGLTEVSTAGMTLKLHFPPASLANVKPGDKINLHLGFTKS